MTQIEFDSYCKGAIRDMVCCHTPGGDFLMVNDCAPSIIGFEPSELIGKSLYEFFHPSYHTHLAGISNDTVQDGKIQSIKAFRFKKKDGSYTWLDADIIPVKDSGGKVINFVTIARDISEVVLLRREVEKKETLFTEASKVINVGIWEIDMATLKPTWSKAIYDIHEVGYDYEPKIETLANFYQGATRVSMINAMKNLIREGLPFDVIVPFTTAKGKNIWVRTTGNAVTHNGEVVSLFGAFQNIHNEVQATNLLQSMVKQLTSQNKQLEEFNHLLSHTVRGPISSMCMLIDTYEDVTDEDDKKEFFTRIKEASFGLNELLTELVDLVKLVNNKDIETENNSIAAVINATMEKLKPTIVKSNALIHVELEEWHDIMYPKAYLESIIYHLMSNALTYTVPERNPVIGIQTTIVNNHQTMIFSDNGTGMDVDRHGDKLFKPHKTFDKERHGKGLGLFTIKSQVEAMGGEIKITSKVGEGTTFVITFSKQKHTDIK